MINLSCWGVNWSTTIRVMQDILALKCVKQIMCYRSVTYDIVQYSFFFLICSILYLGGYCNNSRAASPPPGGQFNQLGGQFNQLLARLAK